MEEPLLLIGILLVTSSNLLTKLYNKYLQTPPDLQKQPLIKPLKVVVNSFFGTPRGLSKYLLAIACSFSRK